MLQYLRRSSTNVVAWLILGALAVVFGFSFGLPSDSISLGPQPIASVHGERIAREDYTYQFSVVATMLRIPQEERIQQMIGVREEVLDAIVERLVLDDLGETMGLDAVKHDAEQLTYNGQLIVLGDTRLWLGNSKFNYEQFSRGLLRNLSVNEKRYLEFQRQEILARSVRDLIAASTIVPESQVRAEYDRDADQLSLRYARFPSTSYAELVDLSSAELDAYVQSHRDELVKKFESAGARFSKLPARARIGLIRVDLPKPLADDADAAAKKAHTDQASRARAKIAAAERELKAGRSFAAVARESSEDADTARRGGDFGWINVEGTGSGQEPVVDEAAKTLEVGRSSGILTGEEALYLVQVEGRRAAGDVPEAEALVELAEDALRAERGQNLARQAANEALLALKSGKAMREMFASPGVLTDKKDPIEDLDLQLPEGVKLAPPEVDKVEPGKGPQLRITGLFSKDRTIPGLGAMPDLTKAAWDSDPKADAIDELFETPDGFVIAGVEDKQNGDDDSYAEARTEILKRLVSQKGGMVTAEFTQRQCLEARARGDISVNDAKVKSLVTYDIRDKDGPPPPPRPFSVCDRVGRRGGLLRQAGLFGGG